ncbi:glycosyltransferase family 4 protein [Algoriphagus sp.]|uniref:glycosyltransferase family 4 protein n=1 Tax=Algoriphagus sp. TaxID=1872435 RepID=UPI0027256069|nr:glycosyltransferase [Algoriphagus sp.]MDO8967491.1 glycosyltransferase [Algoriphagus sp.]MDP3201801.1 glycosyltransferase [Algoriphagus sp.]
MKEKLIFFHLLNNYTGSPQVLRNTILVSKELGKEVHLYTSRGEGFLSGIDGITYHSNYYLRSRFRILTLFTFFLSQFFLMLLLVKYKRDNCTFYVNTILPFSAILMGKFLKKKVIVHVHEYEISPGLLNGFLFWVVRRYADEIVVVSNFLARNPSLRGRNPRVIYNSVKKELELSAKSGDRQRGEFRILMLASLRPYKGITEFLELARTLPQFGFDLILSDAEPDVMRWKSERIIPLNLAVLSVQKDVIPYYQKASLIMNLTNKDKCLETFGMTVLEGMQFGLPAIVPTDGGVTELVVNGENGFLVDYIDLDNIEGLIVKMDSDRGYWKQLSENAIRRSKQFSRENFENEMTKLLS